MTLAEWVCLMCGVGLFIGEVVCPECVAGKRGVSPDVKVSTDGHPPREEG